MDEDNDVWLISIQELRPKLKWGVINWVVKETVPPHHLYDGPDTSSKKQVYKVGMIVEYGRPNGEKSIGEIIKINRKKLKIKQMDRQRGEKRKYPKGTIWGIPKDEKFVKILHEYGKNSFDPRR